jgi:hypothetical protein
MISTNPVLEAAGITTLDVAFSLETIIDESSNPPLDVIYQFNTFSYFFIYWR